MIIEQFMRCLAYCRGLQYDEKPDYQYLRNLIAQAMQKKDFKNDLEFDWFITEKASLADVILFDHLGSTRNR